MALFDTSPNSFFGRLNEWMTPERAIAMQGLGMGLSQLGSGQPVNLGASHQALMERQRHAQMQRTLEESGILSRFTPDQQAILATMPPQAAMQIIAQQAFRQPAAPIEVNGRLVNPQTGEVIADFSSAPDREIREAADGYSYYVDTGERVFPDVVSPQAGVLSPDEVQALIAQGVPLDPSLAYQRNSAGTLDVIGDSGTVVNVEVPGEDEFAQAFARADATTLGEISTAGLTAQRNIPRINELERLLGEAPSGAQGALILAAGELGINTEGLDDVQAAQAIINSLVPEQRQPGSGPMSDADLDLFRRSLPRIINQPGGNETIIRTIRSIAEYDAQGASIVQAVRSGEMTRSEGFAALQARENPLANLDASLAATPSGEIPAAPTGVSAERWQQMWEVMSEEDRALFR